MILFSHPAPNTNVRHAARALERAGVLGEFWTCSRVSPIGKNNATPARWAAHSIRSRRSLDQTVSALLTSDRFKGIYAYEDGAEASFRAAGERGLLRIYDLPSGHWRAEQALCDEEAAREPEWAATLNGRPAGARALARKDFELEQADLVLVSSTFILQTVATAASLATTIAVIRPGGGGSDESSAPAGVNRHGKLRVLFVGELGQRKGLSYLFRACRELRSEVTLTVIGAPSPYPCRALDRELRDVRWQPNCSPGQVLAEMALHDVFLAPSVFEGFNPALIDAMATGLPVIATPHTAAPDLMDDGIEGFIIPVGSTDCIVERLDLLRREPERRAEMAAKARRRAHRHTWECYERTLAASVATALAR